MHKELHTSHLPSEIFHGQEICLHPEQGRGGQTSQDLSHRALAGWGGVGGGVPGLCLGLGVGGSREPGTCVSGGADGSQELVRGQCSEGAKPKGALHQGWGVHFMYNGTPEGALLCGIFQSRS